MRVNPDIDITTGVWHSFYSGEDRLGSIRHRPYGFEAINRLGRPLGIFASESEAADAIAAAAARAGA
jgi:hypothetical protein